MVGWPVWRRDQPVDDRKIELGILRPELVDQRACGIDEVERVPQAAEADRPPLGHEHFDGGRQHAPHSNVGDPRGLHEAAAVARQIRGEDVRPAQSVDDRLDLAARDPYVSVHADPPDLQGGSVQHEVRAAVGGVRTTMAAATTGRSATTATGQAAPGPLLYAGAHSRAAEVLSAGALTLIPHPRRPRKRLEHPITHRSNRTRAERDHEIVRPGRRRDRRGNLVQRLDEPDCASRLPDGRFDRLRRRTGDRILTGRVDVRQDDLVRGAERGAEGGEQVAGPRVTVRLEDDHDAAVEAGARGDDSGDSVG